MWTQIIYFIPDNYGEGIYDNRASQRVEVIIQEKFSQFPRRP